MGGGAFGLPRPFKIVNIVPEKNKHSRLPGGRQQPARYAVNKNQLHREGESNELTAARRINDKRHRRRQRFALAREPPNRADRFLAANVKPRPP